MRSLVASNLASDRPSSFTLSGGRQQTTRDVISPERGFVTKPVSASEPREGAGAMVISESTRQVVPGWEGSP